MVADTVPNESERKKSPEYWGFPSAVSVHGIEIELVAEILQPTVVTSLCSLYHLCLCVVCRCCRSWTCTGGSTRSCWPSPSSGAARLRRRSLPAATTPPRWRPTSPPPGGPSRAPPHTTSARTLARCSTSPLRIPRRERNSMCSRTAGASLPGTPAQYPANFLIQYLTILYFWKSKWRENVSIRLIPTSVVSGLCEFFTFLLAVCFEIILSSVVGLEPNSGSGFT